VPLQSAVEAAVPMQPPYRLLAMGRFVAKKGFDQLLEALRILVEGGLDVEVTLVGDGSLRNSLERSAQRLNVGQRVHFPGFCSYERVSAYFRASDIFVMPSVVTPSSDRDGIPTVILEALMHRLPVIATGVGGIPELVEDSVTGLLVPEKDPLAIAEAVRRLVADRAAALAMAEAGRDLVRAEFDPEKNHIRLLDLYAGLKRTSG
jgi:glycosyltransferase involved in cell wall biosynthesis